MSRKLERRYCVSWDQQNGKAFRDGISLDTAFVEWSKRMKLGQSPRMSRSEAVEESTSLYGFYGEFLAALWRTVPVDDVYRPSVMLVGSSE